MFFYGIMASMDGHFRYSSILAGNTADPDSLPDMVDTLAARTRVPKAPEEVDCMCGKYFLRTNRDRLDEKCTWDYYNLIREIECTNRQLKTDLDLRPIYHQKDDRSDAHLFFGLLAY